MEVKFSEKYQPLFELLECKNKRESKDFNKLPQKQQKRIKELCGVDTILMYGGRNSGKTFAESCFIAIAVKDFNHRVLYTRYTMSSTDDSISSALDKRIKLLGIESCFDYAKNVYVSGKIGKILIAGQKTSSLNQTGKLKSLEDFSMFVTDEADEVKTFYEWDDICKSIRALDLQCLNILVFNPPTYDHWINKEFFEDRNVLEGFSGIDENVMYIHSTFKDNLDYVSEQILKSYCKLEKSYNYYLSLNSDEREKVSNKIKKEYRRYKHMVLGGFREMGYGVIYEDWTIGNFNDSYPNCYGLDFGFNDPNALVRVSVDENNRKIYLKEGLFQNSLGTDDLFYILKDICGLDSLIIGDSASKTLIFDLYDKGLNIIKCPRKDVKLRIKTIQGYELIVDPNSFNLQKALRNYSWNDKRSNLPNHAWSDLCDAFGYAVMELIIYH